MPSPTRRRTRGAALRPADFRAYVIAKAEAIAPADVASLVARSDEIEARAAGHAAEHPLLARRLALALDILGDHVAARCPQIPYYTVALLAAAVFYYLAPVDVIPDVLPGIGTSDDALVVELAFGLAGAGVARYLTWKGLDVALLPARPAPHPPRGARARPMARRRATARRRRRR